MQAKDKERVEQAKTRGTKSSGGEKTSKRSQQNAEQGLNNVQQRLDKARQKVRQSTKAYIVGGGIADALADIAIGDFGEIGNEVFEALDAFVDGIDEVRLNLEAAESDPKYCLPSSSSFQSDTNGSKN